MSFRRFAACLCLLPFAVLSAGCALRPNHVTIYADRTETETTAGGRKSRAVASKVGVSATYDLPPPR